MGIHDRSWYRDDEGAPRAAGYGLSTGWILAGGMFCAWVIQRVAGELRGGAGEAFLLDHVALSLEGVLRGEVWQAATYAALHGSPWHLASNMIGAFVFGGLVSEARGRGGTLRLFLLGAIAGAAAWCLAAALGLANPTAPVIGASGAVCALLAAAAAREPHRQLALFAVLPIPLWILAGLFLVLDLLRFFGDPGGPVAAAVHLGGTAYGVAAVLLPTWRPRRWRVLRGGGARAAPLVRPSPTAREEQARVDALLDRIHAQGLDSLSDEEREFLKRVSERLREK